MNEIISNGGTSPADDFITILKAESKDLVKVFTRQKDGVVKKSDYQDETYYAHNPYPVNDLKGLYDILVKLADKPYRAVLRGKFLDAKYIAKLEEARKQRVTEGDAPRPEDRFPLFKIHPRKGNEQVKDMYCVRRNALLDDVPHHWVGFDFDAYEIDGKSFVDPMPTEQELVSYIREALRAEAGSDFADCDFVYQLSSSAGMGKKGLNCHVWMWVADKMDGIDWKTWHKHRSEVLGRRCKLDPRFFSASTIHYTGTPLFKGLEDPLEALGIKRIGYVQGIDDVVSVREYTKIADRAGTKRLEMDLAENMGDEEEREAAFSRPGVVGAFNRVYSISATINRFLAHEFSVDDSSGRVSWLNSASGAKGGCRIYAGNTKLWNSHNSDPFGNKLASAFDLVQMYLCDDDYVTAAEWAREQDGVCAEEASTDFEDVAAEGFETEYVVTPADVTATAKKVAEVKAKEKKETADEIMRQYPMPSTWITGDKAEYAQDASGAWWYTTLEEDEDGDTKRVFLWSPVTIVGELKSLDTGSVSTCFAIRNKEGERITIEVPRKDLNTNIFPAVLFDKGWYCDDKHSKVYKNWVLKTPSGATIDVLPRRGWNSDNVFAAPDGTVITRKGEGKSRAIQLRSDLILPAEKGRGGTLEGWQEAVAKALEVEGAEHWAIGVAAGFCGPLIELVGMPTLGVSFSGRTSRGKSIALELAASVWSYPEPGKGGMARTFRTTAAAVDAIAGMSNGTILAYDELNTAPKRDLEGILYTISSGVGKEAMQADRTLRKSDYRWSTFTVITGEMSAADYFHQATGGQVGEGTKVRIWDVDVSDFNGSVPAHSIERFQRDGIRLNYGVAGITFVERLIAAGHTDNSTALAKRHRALAEELAGGRPGIIGRTANIPALLILAAKVAGELGVLIPEQSDMIQGCIRRVWDKTFADTGNEEDGGSAIAVEDRTIIRDINTWIVQRMDNSIVHVDAVGSSRTEARVGWYDDEYFYLLSKSLEDACGGNMAKGAVRDLLYKAGMLTKGRRKDSWTHQVPRIKVEAYRLPRVSAQHTRGFGYPATESSETDTDNSPF